MRVFQMPAGASLEHIGEDRVVFDFGTVPIENWCLELCLLKEELSSGFVVLNERRSFKVQVEIGNGIAIGDRALATWSGDKLSLRVSHTELEYWCSFFLEYFRDGVAQVDHIDVEAISAEPGNEGTFITLKVGNAVPPVSSEEVRRRLGLE